MELLGEDADALPSPIEPEAVTAAMISELERKYISASPEVKARVSKTIERGPIGNLVKHANGFRCQLCEALGLDALGFKKRSGEAYVEAHHVMPVATREIGSLSASNIITACANHHRQCHYGDVIVVINETHFEFTVDGRKVSVPRFAT